MKSKKQSDQRVKNKTQSGRSMVEMLGVLAIIAVLSVMSVYAYYVALIKYQANELLNKVNFAYVDTISHDSLDDWTALKIVGLDNVPLKGVIYKDVGYVLADNVDEDVCNDILKNKTNYSVLTLDNVEFITCDSTNSMVFDFENKGDFGLKCDNGDCPLESEGQYCSTNTKTCTMEEKCPNGAWNFDKDACDTCESVHGDLLPVPSENGCISCEENNSQKPVWDAENKICVSCLTDSDCVVNSYCKNTMCTVCPANSGTAVTNNGQINDTSCYCNTNYILSNGTCVANCPANSSTTGTGNVTTNPICRCNANAPAWSNNSCVACGTNYIFSNGSCIANCPANSATTGTGNVTSNPLCRCNANAPWWNAGVCKACSSGYNWNGSTCVRVPTPQEKCSAYGWSYSGGYCRSSWSDYESICDSCPSGFSLSDCSFRIILDTYMEYQAVCR